MNEQQWYEELSYLPQVNEADKHNEKLSNAWNQFREGMKPDWIRESIIESWQRSLKRKIDPFIFEYQYLPKDKLSSVLFKNHDMIEIAHE